MLLLHFLYFLLDIFDHDLHLLDIIIKRPMLLLKFFTATAGAIIIPSEHVALELVLELCTCRFFDSLKALSRAVVLIVFRTTLLQFFVFARNASWDETRYKPRLITAWLLFCLWDAVLRLDSDIANRLAPRRQLLLLCCPHSLLRLLILAESPVLEIVQVRLLLRLRWRAQIVYRNVVKWVLLILHIVLHKDLMFSSTTKVVTSGSSHTDLAQLNTCTDIETSVVAHIQSI